ncbi:MAG TPA: hypothetical protein VFM42_07005 [Sphingomicrobium sp.]|jgi:hypothetical protein|nr:hypothetical protein [Sphingomicrobium sp.]
MSQGRSRADLLKFLDWMSEKGLIPANTASSRKASANKVLALLSDQEAEDVTNVDVDELIRRFGNKHGQQYNPDSLLTYKSRLRSAIDDFRSYCENPVGFRPGGRSQQRLKNAQDATPRMRPNKTVAQPEAKISAPAPALHVVPVAIRPEVTVQIGNLPFDLTPAEAKRIANVILAYAMPPDA